MTSYRLLPVEPTVTHERDHLEIFDAVEWCRKHERTGDVIPVGDLILRLDKELVEARAALAAAPVVEAKPVEWPFKASTNYWVTFLRMLSAHVEPNDYAEVRLFELAQWIESHPVLYEHPPAPVACNPSDWPKELHGNYAAPVAPAVEDEDCFVATGEAAELIRRLAAERDEARAALANVNFRPTIEGEAAAIIERLREERDEARKEVERQMQLRASVEAEHAQMLGEVERLRKLADERGALLTVALRP